ncbi:unnamed protein product [Schistosoma mattheei]|uniref:Uncharacterized protein n=1 Tax=Schistosoma mattheei TaxID=31246 RepID=A0A183Q2G6_9TREM|nr:unnamed protein product [Schistosoma mattheei]
MLLVFDHRCLRNIARISWDHRVKFIPESNDLQIVSCACDSEVRLAQLSPTGGLACPTRLLVKHSRACHKLSIPNGESNIVLSAGADGQVFSTDLRIPKAHK